MHTIIISVEKELRANTLSGILHNGKHNPATRPGKAIGLSEEIRIDIDGEIIQFVSIIIIALIVSNYCGKKKKKKIGRDVMYHWLSQLNRIFESPSSDLSWKGGVEQPDCL